MEIEKTLQLLTQGLVFYGVRSPLYPETACFGIVITARCDLAQRKVKQVHFVTAIPINEWLKTDCILIISDEYSKNCQNTIRNWMREKGLNSNVVEDFGPYKCQKVIETYEKNKSKKDKILKEINKWSLANEISKENLSKDKIVELLNGDFTGAKKNKINLVLKHQLSGYYFIPSLGNKDEETGYIVNLRDIQAMKIEYFNKLMAREIDFTNPDIKNDQYAKMVFYLESETDFAIELGIIDSPQIEHLMQNFAYLYSRIGIEDFSEDYVEKTKDYLCI